MTLRFQYFYYASIMMLACLLTGISFQYYTDPAIPIDWVPNLLIATNVRRNHSERSSSDSKVNYPWTDDPTCRHFSVQFAKNKSLPKWALTSFPGSGVTWTRQLIEGVTGIYTGTAHGSSESPIVDGNHHGNEAEHDCGCTILIKDHGYPETHQPFVGTGGPYENRGILLLRNPFDALFTFGHFLWSGNDQRGTVSPNVFNGTDWDEYVIYVASEWADHAERWIENIQHGTVIFYERLLQDTENELKHLLKAIHFIDPNHPPVDPERMRCALQHKNRLDRKRANKPKVPLRLMEHSRIMSSIERVQASLSKKGWPLLPLHLYDLHKPADVLRVLE
ncbi:WSCD family member CG9164 [Daphnia magna]|uniref:WSCD family member CG9164 n=1 Tax=Daphnia magna TaxID=35525 RepID=UPI001E1BAE2C|nr:WSCD family member CG9164 [Daphnia magna]